MDTTKQRTELKIYVKLKKESIKQKMGKKRYKRKIYQTKILEMKNTVIKTIDTRVNYIYRKKTVLIKISSGKLPEYNIGRLGIY